EETEYSVLLAQAKSKMSLSGKIDYFQPLTLIELQKGFLDEKTIIVEYFLGEQKSFLMSIAKNDYRVYSLPPAEKMNDLVGSYLKMLSYDNESGFQAQETAKRLYRELLFPLEEIETKTFENLVIIPDGILYYLPFETLIAEDEFLIKKYAISYAPSSSSLAVLTERRAESEGKFLLAFGNPVYSRDKDENSGEANSEVNFLRDLYLNQGFRFSPLPYSEIEVSEIAKYFPAEEIDVYVRESAKEEIIKSSSLKKYKIIHFACHGFVDEKFPFRSALVLTLDEDDKEDGFLQAREISNLCLEADLIVLSACQTGKGKLERGEGVLGLPRIFFYSGAKSILTSLWEINDKSTSEFMNFFYRFLSQGKSKAQALREAKLEMLSTEYNHPYYWASFVLNGDYTSSICFD
ncbi:MAG: CHAT domain-containing protein, partial [Candidatus Hydrothermarchaeota archaeon]